MTNHTEHPNPHQSNAIVPLMEAEARKGQVPISLLIKLVALPERRKVRRPVLPGETFSEWRDRLASS